MLIGKYLSLRPEVIADASLLASWKSDPAYIGAYGNAWPTTQHLQERYITDSLGTTDRGFYMMTDNERRQPVGTIGFHNAYPTMYAEAFRIIEVWYYVHPEFRGQGIAKQAVRLLVNHLFDATPTERIEARIVIGNEASCRVARKAGMQLEGTCRNLLFLHGRYADMYLYAIIRSDWENEIAYRQAGPEF